MEFSDDAVILAVRLFGETGAIADILTANRGRYAGLVHGGRSRAMRPVLQLGNRIKATWRARLEDHLGSLAVEPVRLRAGVLMEDAATLDGVAAACSLALIALPEREPHPAAFEALDALLDAMPTTPLWPALLVKWEAGLLSELGYGLDLDACALTGSTDALTHVSPSSGRAVDGTSASAKPWLDKLLKLPPFLLGVQAGLVEGDVAAGLTLTGHFLERRVLWPTNRQLPEARVRLVERLVREGRG